MKLTDYIYLIGGSVYAREFRPERMFPGHGVFVLSGALEHLMLLDDKINTPWTTIIAEIG